MKKLWLLLLLFFLSVGSNSFAQEGSASGGAAKKISPAKIEFKILRKGEKLTIDFISDPPIYPRVKIDEKTVNIDFPTAIRVNAKALRGSIGPEFKGVGVSKDLKTIALVPSNPAIYQVKIITTKDNKITGLEVANTINSQEVVKKSTATISSGEVIFPFQKPVGAAALIRNDHLLMVFDEKISFLVPENDLIADASISFIDGFTIINARVKNHHLLLNPAENNWVLQQQGDGEAMDNLPISFKEQEVSMLTGGQTRPVKITDAKIGDEIIMIPVKSVKARVKNKIKFVDFAILPTIQGAAIEKLSDNLSIKSLNSAVTINSPHFDVQNLPKQKDGEKEFFASNMVASLLPWSSQGVVTSDNFVENINYYNDQISSATSEEERNKFRIQSAEFLFVNEMYQEAIGKLSIITINNLANDDLKKAKMLAVVSFYLSGNYNQARKILEEIKDSSDLKQYSNEINIWNNAINYYAGVSQVKFLDFDIKNLPPNYPPNIRAMLLLTAMKERMIAKDTITLKSLSDQLKELKPLISNRDLENQASLMQAKYAELNGDIIGALKIAQPLTDPIDKSEVRAKAELLVTELKLKNGQMTNQEAIDNLERAKYIWRGDALEAELMMVLGDLYLTEGNYLNALRTYRVISSDFTFGNQSLIAIRRMSKLFAELFSADNSEIQKLTTLEALGLFYEFKELVPIGVEGDDMVVRLSDRLITLDLLEKAAALLDHQLKYRVEEKQKPVIGTKLAEIYLMDQKAREALKTLQETDVVNISDDLYKKRIFLRGQAYAMLGDLDNALAVLVKDYQSITSLTIISDIYLATKDYDKVISILDPYFYDIETLDIPRAQLLLRLAISFAESKNFSEMSRIRNKFLEMVPEEHNLKQNFDFVTDFNSKIDYQNLATTIRTDETRKFIENIANSQVPTN